MLSQMVNWTKKRNLNKTNPKKSKKKTEREVKRSRNWNQKTKSQIYKHYCILFGQTLFLLFAVFLCCFTLFGTHKNASSVSTAMVTYYYNGKKMLFFFIFITALWENKKWYKMWTSSSSTRKKKKADFEYEKRPKATQTR